MASEMFIQKGHERTPPDNYCKVPALTSRSCRKEKKNRRRRQKPL
jgi:hypothetical protein